MDLEFSSHARQRMSQYGISEEQVIETVRSFDDLQIGVGDSKSTNYIKHRIVRGKFSLRVALDPYQQPQLVTTVHPLDPESTMRSRTRNRRNRN